MSAPCQRMFVPRRVGVLVLTCGSVDGNDSDKDSNSAEDHIQGFRAMVHFAEARLLGPRPGPQYPDLAKLHRQWQTQPFFDERCNACGYYGHQATHCDFLTMSVYIQQN